MIATPLALTALALVAARRRRPAATGRRPNTGRARAIQTIAPAADAATRAAGVPNLLPLAIAQAMLETGYGRAVPGGNWYGIKGRGPAGAVNVPTREEFSPGVVTKLRANFRAYTTPAQSVADWLRFVTGGKYAPARTMSPGAAALWIWSQGYATATRYPQALASTARRIAAETGLDHLGFTLTPAQATAATTLGAMPARARAAIARQMLQEGKWPT